MTTNPKTVTFRIPAELHQQLKLRCVQHGVSMEAVARQAFEQFANTETPPPQPPAAKRPITL